MNKKLTIIIPITLLLFSVLFYFFYWIKTPTYSINIIRDSINNHDILKFEKHVDIDRVFEKAYDDSAIGIDKCEGGSVLTAPKGQLLMEMYKPQSLRALKNEALEVVKGNTLAKSTGRTDSERYVFNVRERLNLLETKNIEVKNISQISEDNNTTLMNINIYNKKIDNSFGLVVKMEKLDDGSWKIVEIYNLVDFFVEMYKYYW